MDKPNKMETGSTARAEIALRRLGLTAADMRDWYLRAACKGMNMGAFEATPQTAEHSPGIKDAKTVCNRCPVTTECLADALILGDLYMIRGGLVPRQRSKLLKSSAKSKVN